MKRKFSKVMVLMLLVLVLSIVPVMPAFALTSQDVLVTATPAFIAIANDPGTWVMNDIVGDGISPKGTIAKDTTYYSNPLGDNLTPSDPVVDGECRFTITNSSTVDIDLTVNFPDMAGGDASTNSNLGTNDTTKFGAYSYFSGENYSTQKTIAKASASVKAYENLVATTPIKWGLAYESQSNDWTSGDNMTSTATIIATAA